MLQYEAEQAFADEFLCDGAADWHAYYYISPFPPRADAPWYCVNRTGIEQRLPKLFYVRRTQATPFCQVFCIFSGRGTLHFRDGEWPLHENQIVLLPSGEAHSYRSDPDYPLGLIWAEFYGGDSQSLVRRILTAQPPVSEGAVFQKVCDCVTQLQQKLMADERYPCAVELYTLLFLLLQNAKNPHRPIGAAEAGGAFAGLGTYMDAHLSEPLSNALLAAQCGVSQAYFLKKFKACHHTSPQEYLMGRRITKAKYLLTQTALPLETIAELLGFCSASHLIRRFKLREAMTPTAYRKNYTLYPNGD